MMVSLIPIKQRNKEQASSPFSCESRVAINTYKYVGIGTIHVSSVASCFPLATHHVALSSIINHYQLIIIGGAAAVVAVLLLL
jgi:hypothetical protein